VFVAAAVTCGLSWCTYTCAGVDIKLIGALLPMKGNMQWIERDIRLKYLLSTTVGLCGAWGIMWFLYKADSPVPSALL
jgi:hypothetical protein